MYLRVEMWELVGLGVDPAERFHLLQVGVLRQLLRKVHLREGLTEPHQISFCFICSIILENITSLWVPH